MSHERITADEARRVFRYDAETGKIYWLIDLGRVKAGDEAGCAQGRYTRVAYQRVAYSIHRLAWLLNYGEWPDGEIDHVNGDQRDNRIENLRVVSRSLNMRNIPLRTDNMHGFHGVYKTKTGRWYAQACHGGKNKHLGYFDTLEAAVAARKAFQARHDYHPNHGRAA